MNKVPDCCQHAYLGNLAGDGPELCTVLVANGAALPLMNLLLHAHASSEASDASMNAAQTAAWALSSLTKHSSKAVSLLLAFTRLAECCACIAATDAFVVLDLWLQFAL